MFPCLPYTCLRYSRSSNCIGSFRRRQARPFLSLSSASLLPYVVDIQNLDEAEDGHKEAREPAQAVKAIRDAPTEGNEADNTEDDGLNYTLFHDAYFLVADFFHEFVSFLVEEHEEFNCVLFLGDMKLETELMFTAFHHSEVIPSKHFESSVHESIHVALPMNQALFFRVMATAANVDGLTGDLIRFENDIMSIHGIVVLVNVIGLSCPEAKQILAKEAVVPIFEVVARKKVFRRFQDGVAVAPEPLSGLPRCVPAREGDGGFFWR